jgi:hypothetical protein
MALLKKKYKIRKMGQKAIKKRITTLQHGFYKWQNNLATNLTMDRLKIKK